MRVVFAVVAGLGLTIGAGAVWWQAKENAAEQSPVALSVPQSEPSAHRELASEEPPALPMVEIIGERHVAAPEALLAEQNRDPSQVPVPSQAVVTALRESMENGDPRTPPLVRSEDLRELPSAAELADPDLYQQYEKRQNQKVYASFASAATQKITELETMIARAEADGLPPEQIQEGREKLEGLRNQRDEILQAHPEVAEALQSASAGSAAQE